MSYYPSVPPRRILKALLKAGFRISRQVGSHVYLVKDDQATSVPIHPGRVKKWLVAAILRQAGLSVEELKELL